MNHRSDLKQFHSNVPWVTFLKECTQNFDPSKDMALMNGGYLYYTDTRKIIKNIFSKTASRDVPWVTFFKIRSRNFDP